MEFRILGPLEVLEDGSPLAIGRLKERTVLAVLLLHANEFVSRERLIDELWGVAPPATARKAVNIYISKLRKTLRSNGHDPITTSDGGYRLVVDSDLLDVDRMRRLVADAREHMANGQSDAASRLLQQALEFWRGPTLAGLALESLGRDEVDQLDELRLTVLMDLIDCELVQGRHEQVLGELQVLVREHPLRERLRAQQMLALYRADRQAEALDAYQEARRDLIDELGIEPSESLQRLQQAILRHDPALEAPAGTAARNGASTPARADDVALQAPPPRSRSRRRALPRRQLVMAAIGAVAAVAAAVAVLSTRGSQEPESSSLQQVKPNSLARLDPTTGEVVSDVRSGGIEPGPMAVGVNTLWIVSRGDGTILRYDLRNGKAAQPFSVTPTPADIAADADGNAWVSDTKPAVSWILHTPTGRGSSAVGLDRTNIRVPLPRAGEEAVGGGYLWLIPGSVTSPTGNDRVARIDVRSHKLAGTFRLRGQSTAVAYGFGAAWIGTYDPRHSIAGLSVIRSGSDRPESYPLQAGDGWGPLAIAVGAGSVWALTSAGTLMRIDPETAGIVSRIAMSARQPDLLAAGAGSVWTANLTHSVSQINTRTNKVERTIPLGSYNSVPCGLAATHAAVWVAIGEARCS